MLFDIRFPKFIKNENEISTILVNITSVNVFKFNNRIFVKSKYLGNLIVQKIIWAVGKIKLIKSNKKQLRAIESNQTQWNSIKTY